MGAGPNTAAGVTLCLASCEAAPLLSNLLQLYIHDLSAQFAIGIGDDGRFAYPRLARYCEPPEGAWAYLIRHGEQLAGFALATRGSPLGADPAALDVAEFFVLRAHRRSQVGSQAAHLLWALHPGHWVVRVAADNVSALGFWRHAATSFRGEACPERVMEASGRRWHVLEFPSP